jgi:hypothetical protein
MTIMFIRHLAVVFWGLFIFTKAINQKITIKVITLQAVYSVVLSFAITLTIERFLSEAIIVAVFALSSVFNKLISKNKWEIVITATAIVCGIAYALRVIALVITSLVLSLFINEVNDMVLITAVATVFLLVGVFTFLIFKIRRLKNGFPFLHKKHISLLGVIIALIVFQSYTVMDVLINKFDNEGDILVQFLILSIIVCATLIYIWWRTGITRTFKDSLVDRERDELNRELAEKSARIAEIERDNEALSRIVHNDRKRISALETAARRLAIETSAEFIGEVERVAAERQGELNRYKKDNKPLPTTRITSLDIMLDYMKQKAYDSNIEFDVFVSGSIKAMIEKHVAEEQLRTLAADLLENAIIATKPCDTRQILFTIGICSESDCYAVQVEDSGVAFETATLREIGKKKTTTHADEGGSGIGMIEVFEIMRGTGASLHIEKSDDGRGFTKRVAVRFDNKGEFVC